MRRFLLRYRPGRGGNPPSCMEGTTHSPEVPVSKLGNPDQYVGAESS